MHKTELTTVGTLRALAESSRSETAATSQDDFYRGKRLTTVVGFPARWRL
jgi:hypothetical protein